MGLHQTLVGDICKPLPSDTSGHQSLLTMNGHPGGNDDLVVMVRKSEPKSVCSARRFIRDSAVLEACEAIVDQMEASRGERIFAQRDICDPNLETPLPVLYRAPAEGSQKSPP